MTAGKLPALPVPYGKSATYAAVWKAMDAAMREALNSRPDYLAADKSEGARMAIMKRTVGALAADIFKQSSRGLSR